MKKLLPFLLRLLAISLLFVPFLPQFHQGYRALLVLLTVAEAPTQASLAAISYDGSDYLYTFLVLILAIPEMPLKRRLIGVAVGIGLFLCADLFMTAVWIPYLKSPRPSLGNMAVSYGWLVVTHYLFPFLIWLVFAYRQVEEMCRRQPSAASPAIKS